MIELQLAANGKRILINPATVLAVIPDDDGTVLLFPFEYRWLDLNFGDTRFKPFELKVQESYEKVADLLGVVIGPSYSKRRSKI